MLWQYTPSNGLRKLHQSYKNHTSFSSILDHWLAHTKERPTCSCFHPFRSIKAFHAIYQSKLKLYAELGKPLYLWPQKQRSYIRNKLSCSMNKEDEHADQPIKNGSCIRLCLSTIGRIKSSAPWMSDF